MSTPTTIREALSEIDRLQKQVEILRECIGEPAPARSGETADELVDHAESARVLRELMEGTDPAKGEEFFPSLVRHLASALKMKYAMVSEFQEGSREQLHSLAVWAGDGFGSKLEIPAQGTPCAWTIDQRGFCGFPSGVRQQFPEVKILAALGIESYFAVPLFGSDGRVSGNLVVMHDGPKQLTSEQQSILKIFAARAGAELGRQKAEQALKLSEAHFRALIEQASDVVTVLAADGTVRYQSPSLERILGYRPDERIGRSGFEQMHPEDIPAAQATIRDALEHHGETRSGEFRLRHRNGSWRTLEIVGRAAFDAAGALCIILNMRDITERKRAEEAVRQQRHDLVVAQAMANLGSWKWDIDTGEVVWSDEQYRIFGHEPGSLGPSYESFLSALLPDDHDRVLAAINNALAGQAPYSVEFRIVRPNGEIRTIQGRGEVLRDPHGHPIGMTGTSLDLTERKRAEQVLSESEERYRTIFDSMPDPLLIVGFDGIVRDANPAACHTYGYAREEFVGLPAEKVISPESLPHLTEALAAVEQGNSFHAESIDVDKNGRHFPVDVKISPFSLNGESVMLSAVRDVSERKRAEESIRASEARFRALAEATTDWMWEINQEAVFTYCSPKILDILGYESSEVLGKTPFDFMPEEEAHRVADLFGPIAAARTPFSGIENTNRRKDGRLVVLECRGVPVFDAEGTFKGYRGFDHDITERKEAEEALRQSEACYRMLVDLCPSGVFVYCEGNTVYANQAACRILGADSPEQILAHPTLHFVHPDYHASIVESARNLFVGGEPVRRVERKYLRVDRTVVDVEVQAAPITWNSKPAILGIFTDITERKRAEDRLRATQYAVDHAADQIFVIDHRGYFLDVNESACRRLGYTRQELLTMSVMDIDPDFPPTTWEAFWAQFKEQKLVHLETRHRSKSGEIYPIEVTANYYLHNGQELDYAIVRDITERKRAEEALQTSQEKLKQALEASNTGLWDWNTETNEVSFSRGWKHQLGYEEAEVTDVFESWEAKLHPDDHDQAIAFVRAYLAHPVGDYQQEFRLQHKDGTYRWIEARASFVTELDGRRVRLLGSHTDITERKRAEEALRASEELFSKAFRSSPDPMVLSELDTGLCLDVNDACLKGFGYRREDAVGKTGDKIGHWSNPAERFRFFQLLKQNGSIRNLEAVFQTATGEPRYCLISAELIEYHGKACMITVGKDITEQKRAEQALRDSEDRFARAFRASPYPVGITELETGRCLDVNDACLELFGYSREEVIGKTTLLLGIWPNPDDRAKMIERLKAGRPIRNIEFSFQVKTGEQCHILVSSDIVELNGVPCLLTVGNDITERKRAEEALRQSEAQLKEAQRIAHIGSWELDLVGNVLVWSDEIYRIFEIHPVKFGASYEAFLALVHPDDRDLVNRAYTDSVANRTSYNIVHRLLMPDGRIKFVRERCETQYASDGRSLRSTGTVQDITEQKQAEEALSRREQELRTVLDALPVGVWFTDASGKVLLANPAGLRIWKSVAKVGTNQSFKCEGWWEEAGPSAEPHRWALASALSKGESSLNETLEIECRDGSRKTIRNSAVPVRGDDGRVLGAIVLNEDITDRVRAEQGLRQNHALLSAIMDASIDLIYVKDLDGRYVHMNRAGSRVLGMPIEEVIGWDDVALWGGELAASCRAADRQVIESGETVTVEEQDTTHGKTVHYLTTKAPYRDPEGRIIGVIGVSRDITEQKQAEIERANQYDELQAILGMTVALSRATTLEEIYRKALDGVDRALKTDRASILLFDKQGIMRFVAARGLSEEYRKVVDGHSPWSREAQDPQPLAICDTTTDPTIESYRSVFLSEGIRAMAFIPLMSPEGLLGRFMLYYGEPHKFTENEISVAQTIAGHVAFVIQRAKAEDALRLSEERFAKAFRSSLHPVVIAELDSGLVVEANDAAHQLFGYTREDVAGRTTLQIGLWPSPEDRARFVALLKKQGSVRNLEVSLRMKNGAFRQCLLSSEMIELDGKLCMVTVGNDITDRKRAEEELRQSHAFLRQVIDIDPNFIFAKDRDGRFTLVNKAVADAYGTTVDDLIGKTDADFNPNREEVEHFRAKDLEVMDSLQERFIPEEVITDASGRTRWLQTVKRPILDEHGLASMVLGAATDITERKRMEEELRQRERDLRAALEEREQISQDLHDGILQSLYAMGLSLETCRPLLKKMRAKNITGTLDRVVKQLNEVMGEVRAFIAGLETELWRKQDLASAIRTMVQTLAQPHETRYRILIDPSVNQSITPEQGMHLFSIVKEAMSNCLRHAKAKHATVSLRNVKDGIRLTVSDNGIGFMPARVAGAGHGLANMASRASRVGGTFAIHSKPKQGTRIILDMPKETIHAQDQTHRRSAG